MMTSLQSIIIPDVDGVKNFDRDGQATNIKIERTMF